MSHGTPLHKLLGFFALGAFVVLVSCLSSFTVTRNDSTTASSTFADPPQRVIAPRVIEAAPVASAVRMPGPEEVTAEPPRYRASEAVIAACGQHELWNDCSKLNGFLERMRVEPRDAGWAPVAEARIRRAVEEGERGQFRIRALECRRTRCVLEVASESQTAGIAYIAAYEDGMTADVGTVAPEDDPETGIRTLVFVQIWQKRDTLLE